MPKKWTVMIYMAAGDNLDLDGHAVRDLREMERADIGTDVNVVVQIKRAWPTKPQQYTISTGASEFVPTALNGVNMNLDAEGRVALCAMESEEYRRIASGANGQVSVLRALRSGKA